MTTSTNNTSKLYLYEVLSLMTKSGFLVGLRGLSLKLGGDKKLTINLGVIKLKKKKKKKKKITKCFINYREICRRGPKRIQKW